MLPVSDNADHVTDFTQQAEAAHQLPGYCIQQQQRIDVHRYNLRRREIECAPSDRVGIWSPVRTPGLCEKLLHRYFGPY